VTVTWLNDLRDAGGNLLTSHYLPVDPCLDGAQTDDPRIVVHLHGAHVQTIYDGYPEYTLLPGESAVYVYPNNQLPATLWYHDHALGITRLNVYMGLAGFYLLRDAFELGLGLPSGEYEIPLVQDARSADGTWLYRPPGRAFLRRLIVNGKVWHYLNVKRARTFRILGSTPGPIRCRSPTARFHRSGWRRPDGGGDTG
jgi:spore coat protein A